MREEKKGGGMAVITTAFIDRVFEGFAAVSGGSSAEESCRGTFAYPEPL